MKKLEMFTEVRTETFYLQLPSKKQLKIKYKVNADINKVCK